MITDTTYTNDCSTLQNMVKLRNEAFHKRLKKLYPCVDDVTKLPQGWSTISRATSLGLTSDNLGCYFRGRRGLDEDKGTPIAAAAAAVKADNIIPPSCLLYYFEIELISKGREGFIGLGLSSAKTSLNRLPGWDQNSYGYHAEDGHILGGSTTGHPFGPTSTTGDVVGCGYNLVEGKIFFTRNGTCLGKAFEDVPINHLFYPTIGLRTPGEEIIANFGQKEFRYDIEQDLRSLRKNMTFAISNYPISDFGNWQNTLHKLVQSWLLQNSYPNTAEAFTKSARIECKENMQRVQQRNRIQQLVMSGKISEAIKLTNCICPNLLQDNPKLLFALKCRQFVELISGAESDYQPLFNFDSESNKSNNISSNDNLNKGTNGISLKLDAKGDQIAPPISINSTLTELNANNGIGNAAINNGCNRMTGDKNCEKVDQHSTSSSSYQDLMDVDQPAPPSNNNTTSSSSNNNHRNSSIYNDTTSNSKQVNHNDKSPTKNGNNSHEQQVLIRTTNHQNHDIIGNSVSSLSAVVDRELECNEHKFAKLILFGQELSDYLHYLNKTYGKDDANEKMLRDAISLIAYINPKSDPNISKQLDPSQREPISQLLNTSILHTEMGDSSKPPLEEVMNHLKSLVRLNNSHGRWLVDRLY